MNVDLWYLLCNYSIAGAPVVLATFTEGQTCQLDTSVNVHGEKRRDVKNILTFVDCLTVVFPSPSPVFQVPSCTSVL